MLVKMCAKVGIKGTAITEMWIKVKIAIYSGLSSEKQDDNNYLTVF